MDINQQLTVILYLLLKIKGFNVNLFRRLVEQNFNFIAFTDKDKASIRKNKIPDLIYEQFLLFDLAKTRAYLEDLQSKGVRIISYYDDRYPSRLRHLYDPPVILYLRGDELDFSRPGLAIVGTRKCSPYGSSCAYNFSQGLAQQGIKIISGMAEGIDTCAHRAALDSQGKTIAVLGGGFNHIYPKNNSRMFEEIVANGTVISEYEPDTEPRPYFFPMRNRIITGLADAVMVVEGDIKSGAMISAYLALEQGKEVYALPGDVNSSLSRGPHKLIKEGGKLVESIEDILEDPLFAPQQPLFAGIAPETSKQAGLDLTPVQQDIVQLMGSQPVSIDHFMEKIDSTSAEILSALLELELMNVIKQHPGKLFSRR